MELKRIEVVSDERVGEVGLRRNYLTKVTVNRSIVLEAARRGLVEGPLDVRSRPTGEPRPSWRPPTRNSTRCVT